MDLVLFRLTTPPLQPGVLGPRLHCGLQRVLGKYLGDHCPLLLSGCEPSCGLERIPAQFFWCLSNYRKLILLPMKLVPLEKDTPNENLLRRY
jgi:hypothetical protein